MTTNSKHVCRWKIFQDYLLEFGGSHGTFQVDFGLQIASLLNEGYCRDVMNAKYYCATHLIQR